LGRFTKIFILGEEQMKNYKHYYDFAVDLYNATPKMENGSIVAKPFIKDYVAYNNYFEARTSDVKKRKKD
jgi:hypothetical protein